MKTFFTTAALSLTLAGASTMAFADAHADVSMITCGDFAAMEIIDQEAALVTITAATEGVSNSEIKISDVIVVCNGRDAETVMAIIENEDM